MSQRVVSEAGYRAFISYSQRDKAATARLHRWLEDYRLPAGIQGDVDTARRLGRFFRDDEEMSATADIAAFVRNAIEKSENLIVVCSPRSAQSKWVAAEIQHFRRTGRGGKVFAYIIDGQPNSPDPQSECFPQPLRDQGTGTDEWVIEPLGVDVRKEGQNRACIRLAAGLLGIEFDALWQRDRRRAAQRQRWLVGGLCAGLLVFATLAIAAVRFGLAANENARRTEAARATVLADSSTRLLKDADIGRALAYAGAALDIAQPERVGSDANLRAERAVREALFAYHTASPRLAVTYRGPVGRIADVQLSSDQRLLAAASESGVVSVFRYDTGELVKQIRHSTSVVRIAFVDADKSLLSADRSGTLVTTKLNAPNDEHRVAWGKRLFGMLPVSASEVLVWGQSGLAVWNPQANKLSLIETPDETPVLDGVVLPGEPSMALLDFGAGGALFSLRDHKVVHSFPRLPLGRALEQGFATFADTHGGLDVVDLRSGQISCHVAAVQPVVESVVVPLADRVIARGNAGVEVWDSRACKRIATLQVDGGIGMAASRAANTAVVWTRQGEVTALSLDTGALRFRVSSGVIVTNGAVADSTGRLLLWGDDGAKLISLSDGAIVESVAGHSDIRAAAFSETGRSVWVGRQSGELQIVAATAGSLEGRFPHGGAKLGWRDLGSAFLTWSAEGTVKRWQPGEPSFAFQERTSGDVWGVDGSRLARGLVELQKKVVARAVIGTEKALALCMESGEILIHTDTIEKAHSTVRVAGPLEACYGSTDSHRLVVVTREGSAIVVDLDAAFLRISRQWAAPIRLQAKELSNEAVRVGRYVVLLSKPGRLVVLDPEGKRVVRDEQGHRRTGPIQVAANGHSFGMITARAVLIFSFQGGAPRVLQQQSKITGFSYPGDGDMVATWSPDRSLKLWNASDGSLRHELRHLGIVKGVTLSPDARVLITWTDRRELALWDIATGAKVMEANLVDSASKVRFIDGARRMLIEFPKMRPMSLRYTPAAELRSETRDLLATLRPLDSADECSTQVDPSVCSRRSVALSGSMPSDALSEAPEEWDVNMELGLMKDGGVVLMSDVSYPIEQLQVLEFDDYDQLMTFDTTSGSFTTAFPVPPDSAAVLRRQKTILMVVKREGKLAGYAVPIVQH